MKRRRRLEIKLLELMDKHSDVFEKLDAIKSDIQTTENEVKDLARASFKPGSKRGIFEMFDDEMFSVKVAVKYKGDFLDPEKLERSKKFSWVGAEDGVIVEERRVDVAKIKEMYENGEVEEEIFELVDQGEFQTPAVTIKTKTATSTTMEKDDE